MMPTVSLPVLAIVVPCYNESEVLPESSQVLLTFLKKLIAGNTVADESFIVWVGDGSRDDTWAQINALNQGEKCQRGVKLARNFGHQYALLAGLSYASDADISISIDADLQDDIEAMVEMIHAYNTGADIVYGVRNLRETDTYFKRRSAELFYKAMSMMGVESVYNHADFRLMSKRALEALFSLPERNLYLRGMIPLIGFKSAQVFYDRSARMAGETKYNLRKMISLAWEGITSLTIKPLRFVSFCGFFFFGVSLLLTAYALYSYLFKSVTIGWTSTVIPIYFLGGVQLLCIGLIGEYVAKIYKEVKGRPRFVVDKRL